MITASPGQSASRWFHRHPRARLASLIGGPAAWMLIFYVGSLASLFLTSLYRLNEDGSGIEKVVGLQNYKALADNSVYLDITLRTLKIAALVTVLDILLALPIAFFIAKVVGPRYRRLLVAAVLVPLWASYLVKAFSWRAIIGSPGGVLDKTFGMSPNYGEVGLVVVLAYLWLPYMVVPIYAGLERLPDSLLDASSDLGAHFGFTFRRVVLPLLVPSIVAGSIFTFSLSLGDYIAVDLVGGNTQVIGSVVFDNFSADLPFAAAFAVVPVVIMVAYILGIRRTGALENL
ncbi:MAG TPA: ABC transporter permease [Ilumatobacteraceae bacterium]|nr:ABC transporter permease [Ilumatobacteraceae bacterium]